MASQPHPYDNMNASVHAGVAARQAPYDLASAASRYAETDAHPAVAVRVLNQAGSSSL